MDLTTQTSGERENQKMRIEKPPVLRLEERMFHRRWKPIPWLVLMCCLAQWADAQANPPIRQPLTVSAKFRYFMDSSGAPAVLSGSQTWNTLQDWGDGGTAADLDLTRS